MLRPTYFSISLNKIVTREYDYQNFVKPLYCSCCDTTIYHVSIDTHNKSDFHKTTQYLQKVSIEPIKNI